MANTSAVYERIDDNLKENAENILAQLGITPSSAIQMLYRQIIFQRGLPFGGLLPPERRVASGGELQKGLDSMQSGKMYSVEEVDAILKEEVSQ